MSSNNKNVSSHSLETRCLKSRCRQDHILSEAFREEYLPASSSIWCSWAILSIPWLTSLHSLPLASYTFTPSPHVSLSLNPFSSSYKATSYIGLRTHSTSSDSSHSLRLQWLYFQNRSHPKVLRVRTSAYIWSGGRAQFNCNTRISCSHLFYDKVAFFIRMLKGR